MISSIRDILDGINRPTSLLTWDVETSTMDILHRTYDLRVDVKRFNPDQIVRDWIMLGAAWKVNDGPAQCISVNHRDPANDYEVVRTLHEVLSEADILIGHNADAFDLKKFNARAIVHGLDPIPPKQTIDTLKIARKHFRFTSNKLAYIANKLGVGCKDASPDWNACLEGDPDALRYMRKYNRQDVNVTWEVYLRLRPWMTNHPDLSLYSPVKDVEGAILESCPNCNSPHLIKQGHVYTKTTKRQRYKCGSCGTWSKARKATRR